MNEAIVNITYAGHNADLPDPVPVDATDAQVRGFVVEAVRAGFNGMPAQPDVEIGDFVVERYAANETYPTPRMVVRPKVPFGAYVGPVYPGNVLVLRLGDRNSGFVPTTEHEDEIKKRFEAAFKDVTVVDVPYYVEVDIYAGSKNP